MTITLNGTTGITTPDVTSDGLTVDSTTLVVDEANNRVGIGTSSPNFPLSFGANIGKTIAVFENAGASVYGIGMGGAGSAGDPYRTKFFSNGSERMAITDTGNLLVGKTSAYGARLEASATTEVAVFQNTGGTGNVRFQNSANTTIGYIQWSGSTTSYVTSSDYRLKEDWQPMTGASERVKALKPVNFAWKADGSRVDGFLAHEAQAVVPEAVHGEKDAVDAEGKPVYQGIDQSKLVPLLTAALQEALAEIETLKARVSALEAA